MKEKKMLGAEEIEAQMLIELPDRNLMQATNTSTINLAIQIIKIILKLWFSLREQQPKDNLIARASPSTPRESSSAVYALELLYLLHLNPRPRRFIIPSERKGTLLRHRVIKGPRFAQ
jgi:hypothetical protein